MFYIRFVILFLQFHKPISTNSICSCQFVSSISSPLVRAMVRLRIQCPCSICKNRYNVWNEKQKQSHLETHGAMEVTGANYSIFASSETYDFYELMQGFGSSSVNDPSSSSSSSSSSSAAAAAVAAVSSVPAVAAKCNQLFSRLLLKLKLKHSISQRAVSAILETMNNQTIPPSYLFSTQLLIPIPLELLNIDPSSLSLSSSDYLLRDYEHVSRSAYFRRWDFECIDICANCWAHHWRGVKANHGPHSRVCPKCHFPRFEEDMQYYTKKLLQFDTKHKTKTKSLQEQRLQLVKDLASKMPDYRSSANIKRTPRAIFRYINPTQRIHALFRYHRGFARAVRDGYDRWKQIKEARRFTSINSNNVLQHVTDVHDSEIWDRAMTQITAKNDDPRNLVFGLCADSAELHAYGRSAKIKPLLLTNYGMRRRVRCKSKYLWMVGIPPENHKTIDVFLGERYPSMNTQYLVIAVLYFHVCLCRYISR